MDFEPAVTCIEMKKAILPSSTPIINALSITDLQMLIPESSMEEEVVFNTRI